MDVTKTTFFSSCLSDFIPFRNCFGFFFKKLDFDIAKPYDFQGNYSTRIFLNSTSMYLKKNTWAILCIKDIYKEAHYIFRLFFFSVASFKMNIHNH